METESVVHSLDSCLRKCSNVNQARACKQTVCQVTLVSNDQTVMDRHRCRHAAVAKCLCTFAEDGWTSLHHLKTRDDRRKIGVPVPLRTKKSTVFYFHILYTRQYSAPCNFLV